MNKTILFSPVGGTDPISLSNCYDGSMLHICRVYKPDIVYLYLSNEILNYQKQDDRYRYCLNNLAKMQNRQMEIKEVERPELTSVQDFNYFYEDFRHTLKEIYKQCDETDTILINISSGTPAMKSGLLVMVTLGEVPCKLIQVTTPIKKMNEQIHQGYDVELLWELNEDNKENFENRCSEVQCPNLTLVMNEQNIKSLIRSYDYSAALKLADTMPKAYTANYYDCLKAAKERLLFNYREALRLAKSIKLNCFPVQSGNEMKYFEYALTLEIKRRKNELGDFVRAISPIIFALFKLILKNKFKVNIDDYTYDDNGVKKWDDQVLKNTEIFKALDAGYKKPFQYGFVKSDHLTIIISYYARQSNEWSLLENVKKLRGIEERIRNKAAHEIVTITEDKIKKDTGFSSENIVKTIQQTFKYTGIKIKNDTWNAYDVMNDEIIKRIGITAN